MKLAWCTVPSARTHARTQLHHTYRHVSTERKKGAHNDIVLAKGRQHLGGKVGKATKMPQDNVQNQKEAHRIKGGNANLFVLGGGISGGGSAPQTEHGSMLHDAAAAADGVKSGAG